MTLVLIPGLDGSGKFFEPFLECYGRERAQVIPLPQSGPQDYAALTEYVSQRLPGNKDYVLLGESFGGAIAAELALRGLPRLKGIVFVAAFLSPPAWWATMLGLALPLETVVPTRMGGMILRSLLAGMQASEETVSWVQSVIGGVPAGIIKARIRAIRNMHGQQGSTATPALYLRASQDRLISADKFSGFGAHFPNIRLFEFDGPHLILAAQPTLAVAAIRDWVAGLMDSV